jgi:drug/metabolite transporter (DMT)-like permease
MPDTRKQPAGRLAGLLAVGYVVLWASAYVPSKVAATGAPPLWFLVARFSAAGLVMAAVALGLRRPFPRDWLVYAVLGVLANAAYLGCTYTALGLGLAAGVASIVASTNPLILALVAPRLLAEPLTGLKTLGLALGFAGVIGVVVARGGSASAQPALVGLAFIGVASNVASTILFKRARGSTDLLAINTIQLLAAGVALIPVAFALEGFPAARPTPELLESFAYLVGVLSVGASLLWFWLLSHGAASRVSAFYFLTPVFGLFFGAALLNETVVPTDALGLVAIALGIVLVQRS